MFTGIVERLGEVISLASTSIVVFPMHDPKDWVQGESVSVNGCCLTVVSYAEGLRFDVSPETLARTSLGSLAAGDRVNLERAMPVGARFGGHIVQGHVDATGVLLSVESRVNSKALRIEAPVAFDRYLIDKGSVTVDGISLTVVSPRDGVFEAWIVPHTWEATNLHSIKAGARVNLEFDVIAKYVEKLLGKAGN